LGVDAIPEKFLTNLELRDVIVDMANDLFNDCQISEYGSYRDDVGNTSTFTTITCRNKKEIEKLRTAPSMLF
jgi:hypothetical protein